MKKARNLTTPFVSECAVSARHFARAGIRSAVLRRDEFVGDESVRALVLTYAGFRAASTLPAESYQIRVRGKTIYLNAADRVGAMYGLLELAEIVTLEGYDAVTDRDGTPFLEKRGVKFNWPYEPFGEGDPFRENEETVLDIEFWRTYIDFLAENRYNLLSIWSMNPFEMMFRVPKYPNATPYSDVELERFRTVFDFIFTHAKNRGIATYLITWNLRITPAIARGLGLPEQTAIPCRTASVRGCASRNLSSATISARPSRRLCALIPPSRAWAPQTVRS